MRKGRGKAGHDRPNGGLVLGRHSADARQPAGFVQPVDRGALRPGTLIEYAGEGHLLCVAPTGGGKTSGPAIVNMRRHPGAAVCVDPKGTIHEATADYRRRMGHEVAVIDLREGRPSARLEPIGLARRGAADPETCGSIVAEALVPRSGLERDPYWPDGSCGIIGGLAAELCTGPALGPCCIGTIHDAFSGEDVVYSLACKLDNGSISAPVARTAIAGLLSLPDNTTRPCMISSVQQYLRLWNTALIRDVTGETSFDLDTLIAGGPVTLYIIVPPSRLGAFAPLLRLWLAGLLGAFSTREQVPEHHTLLMIDEAASLGRFDPLVTAMTLLRSWGVQICTFWQSLGQLDLYAEQARTMIDNAGVIQLLAVRNGRMAREFAELIGGMSEAMLTSLGPRQQVLAIEGGRPFVCDQVRHYDDPLFTQAHAAPGPRQ